MRRYYVDDENISYLDKIILPVILSLSLMGFTLVWGITILIICFLLLFCVGSRFIILNLNSVRFVLWLFTQMTFSALKLVKLLYQKPNCKTTQLKIDGLVGGYCLKKFKGDDMRENSCFLGIRQRYDEKEWLFSNTITLTPGTYTIFCSSENEGYYIINTIYPNINFELNNIYCMRYNKFFKGI